MPITNGLPSGDNKCIGSYSSEPTNKLYSFIWNSEGNHTINEYDTLTNTIFIILQGDFLQFDENAYINGCGLVGGNLLYWTDGLNPPRGIDITKARTGVYYLDSASICLIKKPPQTLITAEYINDNVNTNVSNRLKNQLFQFRYLYVYEDGSRSAWSSCSELPLPIYTLTNQNDPFQNNGIAVTFDVGGNQVTTIEIAAQVKGVSTNVATTDWFSIFSLNKNELGYYNPETNLYTVNFFNDGLYQSVDVKETDLPFDFVPLKSKTLEVVNGNVLVLGNNTEGYDNIETDISLSVEYVTPVIDEEVVEEKFITYYLNGNVNQGTFNIGGDNVTCYQLTDDGTVQPSYNFTYNSNAITFVSFVTNLLQPGELVIPSGIFNFNVFASANTLEFSQIKPQIYCALSKYNGTTTQFIASNATTPTYLTTTQLNEYVIPISIPETQLSVTDRIIVTISIKLDPFIVGQQGILYTQGTNQSSVKTTFKKPNNSLTAKPTYKTNSKYQFGLVYYDEFNRSSYVQTNNSYIVNTDSWGETEGKVPNIYWSIKHNAPLWATKYQWVRTEQLTHKSFLFWVSGEFTEPDFKDYYELDVSGILAFKADNPSSILNYSWSAGDRCTIHKQNTTWVTNYDVEIVGTVVTEDTITLQISKKTPLVVGTEGILLEIYTPKTRANTTKEQFFYEFGEQYDCYNGVHSIVNNVFIEGDIYIKKRNVPGYPDTLLEDPNYSDFYVSNYSSNGRTNIFAPQAKQLTLPTDIRYSDTYVPNTNINGLSRFYGDSFETYDRVNGSIQKLAVRDNYLMTFQELKTGYIPINQSIIEDQGSGNEANVAISNKLLNKIRYLSGDYGIGKHPESFARFAGVMYFADPNRNEILKLTQGLQPVSKIGMDSYFTAKLSYTNNIANSKVLGSYDPRNDEYIVTFKYPSGENEETIAFSEDINRWTSFYSFKPEYGCYIFNQYFTFNNGLMWAHNTNSEYGNFYGTQNPSTVSIVYNGSPSLIKTFIGVIEQSSTPWVPTEILTSTNQFSELPESSFSLKEGVYFSSLLRAKTEDIKSLYFGDDLKGNWIKLNLDMTSDTKETLLSVDVRHIASYQGIK